MNGSRSDAEEFALQRELLDRVSRTFALTIPALPQRLERVVGNAYLLCRITDTIEDVAALDPAEALDYCERFISAVAGDEDPAVFSRDFARHLASDATPDERRLIAEVPRVLAITASFETEERAALSDCVAIMGRGMAAFQQKKNVAGLANLGEHARYCYVVAGCVGEMLTRLFVETVPELEVRRGELLRHAVAFGQCLQMTNILKDFWEDRARGACWLPRDVFLAEGLDLTEVRPGDPAFVRGYRRLVGLAHTHAENALRYTLAIPSREAGIRNFCLWALFMAVLTQRKLISHPNFAGGVEVKIRRRSVRLVVAWCRAAASSDFALRTSFAALARGLPSALPTDLAPGGHNDPGAAEAEASS